MNKAGLLAAVIAFGTLSISPVRAQFNQVIVFGDSNVDSGFYKALSSPGAGGGAGGSNYNASWPAAVAHGAGAPTSNPSPLNVQVLAAYFGLTATPANTAGGTNYATSGAKNVTVNSSTTGGFTAAVPTVTQIQNYLTANGGVANAQALFVIWSGDNDVSYADGDTGSSTPSDPNAYVVQAANDLAAKIVVLRNAGARKLIVSGLAYGFPTGSGNATKRALKLTYTNTLWNALDSAGVIFTRSDIETVREDIVNNRVAYGFDYVDTNAGHMACNPVIPNPSGSGTVTIGSAWSLLCSSDAAAPSQYLSPTAPETMLFADDQHLAAKGQRIVGNYLIRLALGKTAHDFNGDGKSDILWRNTGGSNAIWQMNGATVSAVALLGGVDTSWAVVGQRDFDGDGKTDILWRNSGGSNAIWFMNGSTVTSVSLIGGVGPTWAVVGTADLNGDGKGDIIWRNTDGTVAVWLMNGATVSSVAVLGGIGTNWTVAGTADFDGDGKGDILWRENGGSNAIWFMNGASIASVSLIGGVGTSWTVAGTGDFNGDGKGDILWREAGGSNAVWFMNGATVSSVALIGGVGTNWSVASNGDYDGDGKGDILWREAGGSNAIWFMNGSTVSSVSLIGGVATNWTVQNAGAN